MGYFTFLSILIITNVNAVWSAQHNQATAFHLNSCDWIIKKAIRQLHQVNMWMQMILNLTMITVNILFCRLLLQECFTSWQQCFRGSQMTMYPKNAQSKFEFLGVFEIEGVVRLLRSDVLLRNNVIWRYHVFVFQTVSSINLRESMPSTSECIASAWV